MLSSVPTPGAFTAVPGLELLAVAVADVALLTAADCDVDGLVDAVLLASTGAGGDGAIDTRSTPAASAAADSDRISAGRLGLVGNCTPSLANSACTCGRPLCCDCRLAISERSVSFCCCCALAAVCRLLSCER